MRRERQGGRRDGLLLRVACHGSGLVCSLVVPSRIGVVVDA